MEIAFLDTKTSQSEVIINSKKLSLNKIKLNIFNFIRYIDDFLGFKKVIINQVAPIFSGRNISTDLIISNMIPDGFKYYAANFNVEIILRNIHGKIVDKDKISIRKNTRLVYDLNKFIFSNSENIMPVGSLWLKIIPKSKGFLGVTRPHIRIRTDKSVSAIHLQHGKKKPVDFATYINNIKENQYISVVNLEDKAVNLRVLVNINGNASYEHSFKLSPKESNLINIFDFIKNKNFKGKAIININHDGIIRRNLLVENIKNSSISIDHI